MKWKSRTRSVLQKRSALCHDRNITRTYDGLDVPAASADTAHSDTSWNRMFVKMNVPVIIWMTWPHSPVSGQLSSSV